MFKYFVLPALLCSCLLPVNAWSDAGDRELKTNDPSPYSLSQLSSLVNEVIYSNPAIQAVRAERDAAIAKTQAAEQPLYNPELGLDVENTDIQTSSLGITQTIDWSDKRGARSQAAQYEKNSFTAKLQAARQALAGELLQALVDYHTYQDMDALTQQRIELLQGFVELAEKRRQAGDLSQAELTLAQLALAEARMHRTRAASRLMETRQLLITLVGGDGHDWPGLPDSLPTLNLADENIDELLHQLPILQEQLSKIGAAKARIHLRSREQRPDPTIGLRGGREDDESLVGVTLSIPLYVRNNFRAEVDVANAELIQAEGESQNIARKVRSKLFSSARRYQLVRETWQGWQQTGQASLTNQLTLIQRLWQAREINTTDYFMQLNQTLDTRASAIELRQDLWRAWTDWLLASGQVNSWLGLNN